MGWPGEDALGHEGYMQVRFGDGAAGSGSAPGSMPVSVAPDGTAIPYEQVVTRPAAEVAGWGLACNCSNTPPGWVSPHTWNRVPSPGLEDLGARKLHCDDDPWISDRPDVETLAIAEWERDHLAPATVVGEIRHAREESLSAANRLEDAVRAARNQGVPWSTIGSAAGMSRQAAHERWSS